MNRRKFFGLLAAAPLVPLIPLVVAKRHSVWMPIFTPENIAEIYRGVLATEFGPYDIPEIRESDRCLT